MGWEELTERAFEFKAPGDSLRGRLRSIREGKYSKIYTFELADGGQTFLYGCTKLDHKLQNCLDKFVMITHLGTKTSQHGKSYKDFEIKVWASDDGSVPEEFNNDFLIS